MPPRPAVILPNQLPGNPQRDHMMNSDPSNMSTVALRLAGGCAGIWRRQARRPKGGRLPLNARGCAGIWLRQGRRPKGGRPPLNAR